MQFNQHAASIMYSSPYDFPSPTEMSVIICSALILSNTKIDLWFTSPRSVHTNTRIPAPHPHTQSAWRRGDVLTSLVINSDGAQLISNSTSLSFQQWEERSEELWRELTHPNWYIRRMLKSRDRINKTTNKPKGLRCLRKWHKLVQGEINSAQKCAQITLSAFFIRKWAILSMH